VPFAAVAIALLLDGLGFASQVKSVAAGYMANLLAL